MTIDVNCDLGESFGAWSMGRDEEVVPFVSSVNAACGFHAGDPVVMRRTVALARKYGAAVGAHPGFPDLQGFGRRAMALSPDEVKACVQYQIGALAAFCRAEGVPLVHVKPHGALYNAAASDARLARAVAEAVREVNPGLVLLALAGSRMTEAAREAGVRCAEEVFADRAYEEDGSLAPRGKSGAVIADADEAAARAVEMALSGRVRAITGKVISVKADSVCVHGDGPQALLFVRRLREAFAAAGITVAPLG